ncbi:uncharacterized protein LOC123448980 [Hordeum vulgare subsp. vulgare]|uniref:DUF4378 domain-containing protein n=1 Tax=Hordeum vulgare subsp. vulgare TaxID=112509 RepID=A0A8I7B7C2_HORVV|nr:uncharacterized protein LOC123448980 [Hordeum vulgare subsp. vulgare]
MASVGRSRSRRRGEGGGPFEWDAARSGEYSADHHGAGSSRKQASNSGVLSHTLFDEEIRKSKPRQSSCVPMKKLIDEEFSKDVNARHTSPGAVGRLMGLDSLPTSSGTHSQHRSRRNHAHRTPSFISHDRYVPQRRKNDEMPEVKDVFEVMDVMGVKAHRSPRGRNGNATSIFDATEKANLDFIRHKFMDAKRLSTNESLQMSEELNETLDALVSNKDLLLEFLEKRDLDSASSNANCITILKPSKRNQFIDADNIYSQDNGTESFFHKQNEVKHSMRKPHTKLSSQSPREDSGLLRQKLSRSSHQEISDKRACPTRIVVLKPSFEKAQGLEGSFGLPHEIPYSDYRRHTACQCAGMWSPYTDEASQVSPGDPETSGHIKKGSREIAREVGKQMRAARGHVVQQDTSTILSDESSQIVSSLAKLKNSERVHRSFELCDGWASPSFNTSPAHSNDTSVINEAKKQLSSRWKIAHQFQHQEPENNGFGMLGEMFVLSDEETSKVATQTTTYQKCPKGELQRNRVPVSCSNPLGISSKDGWRGGAPNNSARAKSLPSFSNHGVQKLSNRKRTGRQNEFSMLKDVLKIGPHDSEYACHSRQRKSLARGLPSRADEGDQVSPDDEGRTMIDREIHVSSMEAPDVTDMPDSSEKTLAHTVNSGHEIDGVCHLDTSSAVFEQNKEPLSPAKLNQHMHQQPSTAFDFRLHVPNFDNLLAQAEGIENHVDDVYSALFNPPTETESPVGIDHHDGADNDNQASWIHPTGSESPVSSNNDEQPSPVSVLESSLDAEEIYSGDFEKISADLQGLRMQLQLLKTETTDDGDEDNDHLKTSDDEVASTDEPLAEMEIANAFMDEEERDFSYVLDMLTLLGIDGAFQDGLLDVRCFSEYPAGPDIYDILENKYSSLILWPASERMLLFELTNTVIADLIASLVHHGSKGLLRRFSSRWDQDGFVVDVWQRVFELRQETDGYQGDPLMMDFERQGSEDSIDLVGGEMERMLLKDLVEETIAEFLGTR